MIKNMNDGCIVYREGQNKKVYYNWAMLLFFVNNNIPQTQDGR